jgi:hypothetical protein
MVPAVAISSQGAIFGGTVCMHHAIRVNHTEIRCSAGKRGSCGIGSRLREQSGVYGGQGHEQHPGDDKTDAQYIDPAPVGVGFSGSGGAFVPGGLARSLVVRRPAFFQHVAMIDARAPTVVKGR